LHFKGHDLQIDSFFHQVVKQVLLLEKSKDVCGDQYAEELINARLNQFIVARSVIVLSPIQKRRKRFA